MADNVHIVYLSILLLLFSTASNIFPQYSDIRFDHLTTEDGLSESIVLSIYQDSRGFLWFGTESGLNRYDGYNFRIFQQDPDDPSSLSNNLVQVIVEDDSSNLWIGTLGGGLDRFNISTEEFVNFRHRPDHPSSLSDNDVLTAMKDNSGYLWVGTNSGGLNKLISYDKYDSLLSFIHYVPVTIDTTSLGGVTVNAICEDKSGVIWIGTNNGLSRYVRENDRFITYRHNPDDKGSLSSNKIMSVFEDSEGDLWVGTNDGGLNKLMRNINEQTPISFDHFINNPGNPFSVSNNSILTMHEDEAGLLWLGTLGGGVNVFNKNNGRFISYGYDPDDPASLSGDLIWSIYEDNSGIIWIGSYNGWALSKYDKFKQQFNPYNYYLNKPANIRIKNVFQIIEDGSGFLWLGTYEGLYKFDRKNNLCINYSHNPSDPTSLSDNKVGTLCEDKSGTLWIGTHGGGINLLDKKSESFAHYQQDPDDPYSLSSNIVQYIYEDRSGTIWICTYGGGLNKYNKEKGNFVHYLHNADDPKSLADNRPRYAYEDQSHNFWIGNWSHGLSKFDRESEEFTHYMHDPDDSTSISGSLVYSIYEDGTGSLWISTDGGLNKFDRVNGTFRSYRIHDGLPDETIYGVLEDDKQNLWMSTNNGLSKFDPRNEIFKNFDVNDGLQDNEFNPRAYYKTRSGELIFGGLNGFNIFHPDSLRENTHVPPVVITDFKLFNESVTVGFSEETKRTILTKSITECSELTLEYTDKVISFEFAALDFHAPSKNKYAYIMEGFEENWNYTDAGRRFVTYTNLDPGEYIFKVKASNNRGIWNAEGTALRIFILPPWWQTGYAYFTYAALVLLIIYFTWKMQIRRIRIKHEYEMSKFEAEKMHEVDEMKNRFFTNLSHEFRTPLTLIFGPAKDILENTGELKTKEYAGIIKRNANRLYNLVNQLLDLSKLEAGRMKLEAGEQNIIPLLKGSVLSFSSLAERRKITLNFNATEERINVYLDKDKIEKIINNLLSNSFKFTPEGGKIDFIVEKSQKYVEIIITDNGIGIPAEKLDKIFNRFYQVDGSHTREGEGTGIGLSLTKELVELHKGKIEVESKYGKGTTFKVLIPSGKEHLKPEDIVNREAFERKVLTAGRSEISYETENVRMNTIVDLTSEMQKPLILLVEDNPDVRKYIIGHLEEDYTVSEAVDGKDGLKRATDQVPDLIISDIMMPLMDGFELCEKIKTDKRTSHIPVILLTAKATAKDKTEGYETGADDYIMKPFDTDVLKARIKNLIDQRRKLSEHFRKEGLFEIENKDITSTDKRFLQNVVSIIKNHLSDTSFGVEVLAAETSMSRRNLDRKLNAMTGETPGELIRRIRLTFAAELIKRNFGNISEIALEAGFSSPAYFSKCFREQFGLAPSEYNNTLPK